MPTLPVFYSRHLFPVAFKVSGEAREVFVMGSMNKVRNKHTGPTFDGGNRYPPVPWASFPRNPNPSLTPFSGDLLLSHLC